jgi:hypothetical protein
MVVSYLSLYVRHYLNLETPLTATAPCLVSYLLAKKHIFIDLAGPDMIFVINGQELHVSAKDYVQSVSLYIFRVLINILVPRNYRSMHYQHQQ